MTDLPIEGVLQDIKSALSTHGRLVLQAPPGAGKTTRVPLFLMEENCVSGKIIMLEPRRVAARSAARHIAGLLAEPVGQTVGYRMRGESKTSDATRLEIVTEGVLTRMIQSDPELSGIGCIIFDEFHERTLHADLGLALTWEVRGALRPDLNLIVMSATLDAAPVAKLMDDAPVVTSEGRSFPIETIWLEKPWSSSDRRGPRFEVSVARLVEQAVAETNGGVLVFLPGAGEIARVQAALNLPDVCEVVPLYGALPFKEQTRALEPAATGRRRIVLATSIAETSLTLPDIRVVVDGGLARRPSFDPGSGMMRLVTTKVSQAEATQRAGRAGRVAPGRCYRHWTKGENGALAPFPPVEIEDNDLMGLALELANWGARDADDLAFLTPPPKAALSEAIELLTSFGALTDDGQITDHGRAMSKLPLHPRLAHMVIAGRSYGMHAKAPRLAALLEQRSTATDIDAELRSAVLTQDAKATLKRLNPRADEGDLSAGALVSLAFPDRIAQLRSGQTGRFLMSGGRGAILPEHDPLAAMSWLAIAELDGSGRDAKVRRAAPLRIDEIELLHPLREVSVCVWDKRANRVVSEMQTRLGAIVVDRADHDPGPDATGAAMVEGVRLMGLDVLPWSKGAKALVGRAAWINAQGGDIPDMTQGGLLDDLEEWLLPHLGGALSRADLSRIDLMSALKGRIGWDRLADIDRLAPEMFRAPTGTGVWIDYEGAQPKVSVRLQEMMGVTVHPVVGPQNHPLLIELLSPAGRPLQTTSDLPNFWRTSYLDVRKDMRGRYPKHHWPEDPSIAEATRRVKHPKRT